MRERTERARLRNLGQRQGEICCRKCNRNLGLIQWLKKRKSVFFIHEPKFFDDNKIEIEPEKSFQENMIIGNSILALSQSI